jgi:hypothetical protein
MKRITVGAVSAALIAIGSANAADLPGPVYKSAPMAATVDPSGFYVWADGAANWLKFPSYGLGFHNAPAGFDGGLVTAPFDPKVTAAGISGGLGYITANGIRFEINGSFIQGSGTQTSTTASPALTTVGVFLNGTTTGVGFGCGATCIFNNSLSTNYRAWQINDVTALDYRTGSFVWTPSVTLFGGNARNSQSFTQVQQFGGITATYNANTRLDWTDVGGRVGLNGAWNVNNWFTLGAGGFVAGAYRATSLAGTDVLGASVALPVLGPTSISPNSSTGDFMANAEVGASVKLTAGTWFKAFAGLNFDNRVPGISAPSFSGIQNAATPHPAGISYASETDYYAGGGLVIKFGGS